MRMTWKSLPALMACWIVCLCSGCAGTHGLSARSDNFGGAVVYDTSGPMPRAVARIDADGNRYVMKSDSIGIERGGGGVETAEQSGSDIAQAYCGPSDGELWLAFTVVYLIVLLIEAIIAAIDEAN
jgi:hypothetical protein